LKELHKKKQYLGRHAPSVDYKVSEEALFTSELKEIFSKDTIEELSHITGNLTEVLMLPEATVLKKGEKGKVYLVVKGMLCESSDRMHDGSMPLKFGDVHEEKSSDFSEEISEILSQRSTKARSAHRSPLNHEEGEIAGLQNILPPFDKRTKTEIYVEKSCPARIIELNVKILRKKLLEDSAAMLKYWIDLAPKLVHSHHF